MPDDDNPQFIRDDRFGPAVRWKSGWMLMLSFSGRLHEEGAALCGLVSPDGDGYWSRESLGTTNECKEEIAGLVALATKAGFLPPDAMAAADVIPHGFIEREIRGIAEEESSGLHCRDPRVERHGVAVRGHPGRSGKRP